MKPSSFLIAASVALASLQAAAEVPNVTPAYDVKSIEAAVAVGLAGVKDTSVRSAAQNVRIQRALVRYMAFLKINPKDKLFKDTLNRLISSSTQLLLCEDIGDWECLEKKPELPPLVEWRRDTQNDLGAPVSVPAPLQMETYFTQRWAQAKRGQPLNQVTVAQRLGEKIRTEGRTGVFMALYGIDDIAGSMKPVFSAIQERHRAGVPTFGVFDVADESGGGAFLRDYDVTIDGNTAWSRKVDRPLDFSYIAPADQSYWIWGRPAWIDQLVSQVGNAALQFEGEDRYVIDAKWLVNAKRAANATRINFQYKGTTALINELNAGIATNEASHARIEWPTGRIMHNKFVVLDNNGQKSVWSGTANVAQTCMGDETNSNMSIYIKNTEVAESFLAEFKEMFTADPANGATQNAPNLVTGRFHAAKRPNTKRYFRFTDGHELRVHFSPTDDGEHRAIIPMLLSAKAGDRIRISMFGAGGMELLRALQFAAAQGASVQILLDSVTGSNKFGWMKSPSGNVFDTNPYSADAKPIEVKISTWLNKGLNHHKTATLSRYENGSYRAEVLIVGSQNWSASGNDGNDENMVTIRHLVKSVAGGEEFNKEFDENLWPLGEVMTREKLNAKNAASSSAAMMPMGLVGLESASAKSIAPSRSRGRVQPAVSRELR